jgi:hypothetical protein
MNYGMYNRENEWEYYYAPFSQQRKDLRRVWNTKHPNTCWEEFLYKQEQKHQRDIVHV